MIRNLLFSPKLRQKRIPCSSIFNQALSTMFPKGLFLEGLNVKRAIFLLICTIGNQGLLISSLIFQHTDSSTDNILSLSLWVQHGLFTNDPYNTLALWPCCSGVHPNICVEDSCQDWAIWLLARSLVTVIPLSTGPVQFMKNESPEDFNNRNEGCCLPYYQWSEAKWIFQSQKL